MVQATEQPIPKLKDLIRLDTPKDKFERIAVGLLSDNDRNIFGEGAKSKVITSFIYLAPFAPEPATFDINAYKATCGLDESGKPLKEEEISRLLQIAKDTGVVKDAPNGRMMIDKDTHPLLVKLLDQYDE